MTHTYRYPRPALTVDCVIFALGDDELEVLLIKRGAPPFEGRWALPGGFVNLDETVEEAARRELAEETGLERAYLEQLYTFSAPDRDPRERVISVAHYALVPKRAVRAASDAAAAAWVPLSRAKKLAFDHDRILAMARDRLRGKLRWAPIGFELLPRKFTLGQLQRLYEVVLGVALDKRNFRKKLLAMNVLEPLDERERGVPHRAAQLYRFDEKRYRELEREGQAFEL